MIFAPLFVHLNRDTALHFSQIQEWLLYQAKCCFSLAPVDGQRGCEVPSFLMSIAASILKERNTNFHFQI